jgi:hypothetical protein
VVCPCISWPGRPDVHGFTDGDVRDLVVTKPAEAISRISETARYRTLNANFRFGGSGTATGAACRSTDLVVS